MREISVFDIIGPIMIGPSSSHTAGALKIARVARALTEKKIVRAEFRLFGSFAKTYQGHGTDRALLGGILGFDTGDYRIRDSFALAKESGLDYLFIPVDGENGYHPNTAIITLTEEDGKVSILRGASVGGGEIEIQAINGFEIRFSGKYNAIVVNQADKPGVVSSMTRILYEKNVNIAFMSVYSKEDGIEAFSVIEIDGELPGGAIDAIREIESVHSAIYVKVK